MLKKKEEPAKADEIIVEQEVQDVPKTVLAQGVLFEGSFKSDEPMLIHGEVQGDIKSTSSITLSEQAKYSGVLSSDSMFVAGVADGTFTCKETVEIAESGKIKGDLVASRFIMSEEAVFEGNLKVKKPKKTSKSSSEFIAQEQPKEQ